MTPRATVTILFTDIVESTELLRRAGDERAQRIFRAHHKLLRDAVAKHGGAEVKWLGDGLMVAFPSAVDAVRCAISMQQAARRPADGERLQIRVGLNVGDVLPDATDYFGSSVVLARRLCDAAGAGQIYAAEVIARLVEGNRDLAFRPLPALDLKGFDAPVASVEVAYEHDPLALLMHTPFVGRREELQCLYQHLQDLRSGSGSLVLLAGEPGIGKTRTVSELADSAEEAGVAVHWGHCLDGDWAAPFQPFVEVVRSCLGDTTTVELGLEEATCRRVAALVGEAMTDGSTMLPDQDRFLLLDAVADVVAAVATRSPILCIIDDLHWADRGSVAMLQHLVRTLRDHPVLFAGTYRDVETAPEHALASAITLWRRESNFEIIRLEGLEDADVGALLKSIADADLPYGFASAVCDETDGNPLFIREILIHLIEELHGGTEQPWASTDALERIGVPDSVRDVIGRRVRRLGQPCRRMLSVASAMSGGFSWEMIRTVTTEDETVLLDALDEALGAQLLAEAPGGMRFNFTHALVRSTLYDALSGPRRATLHRSIGEAIEALPVEPHEAYLAELAYHFSRATAGSEVKAIEYARRAGDRALSVYAYDEAVREYERGLDAAGMDRLLGERRRCQLLVSLGEAHLCRGDIGAAKAALWDAAGIARTAHEVDLFARAALGFAREWEPNTIPRDAIALLDEALEMVGAARTPLRARLLAAKASALFFSPDLHEKDLLIHEAIEIARESGDAAALAFVLYNRHFLASPGDSLEERLAAATEIIALAEQRGDTATALQGHGWRVADLMEMGEVDRAYAEADAVNPMVRRIHLPRYIHATDVMRSFRAIFEGRLDEAEPLVAAALASGQAAPVIAVTAMQIYGAQTFALRWMQGRLAELEGLFAMLAQQNPGTAAFTVALAFLYSETGRTAEARAAIDSIAGRGFADLPPDATRLLSLTLLAQAVARAGSHDQALALYGVLLPYADRNVTVALVAAANGSCERYLGILARVLRRWDEGAGHFERALAANERMRARPYVAFTQADYADLLLERDCPGDRIRAVELLRAARATATEIGLTRLRAHCEHLLGV